MLQKLSTATRMFDKMEPNKQPWFQGLKTESWPFSAFFGYKDQI